MADALRSTRDAAAYRHVVAGLVLPKYIPGGFEEHHANLLAGQASGDDPEAPDEYRAQSISWVPPAGGRVLGHVDTIGRSAA